MVKEETESICLSCIYGSQPFNYYPIVCVRGRMKEMWYDKHNCKHFEKVPEQIENKDKEPWEVVIGKMDKI